MRTRLLVPALSVVALVAAMAWLVGVTLRANNAPPQSGRVGHMGVVSDFPDTKGHPWVSPKRGYLVVWARSVITDHPWDETFVWYVRVRDANREVVIYEEYDWQPYRVRRGESRQDTFRDSVQVPPGRYHVEVGLKSGGSESSAVGFQEIVR